MKLRFVTFVLVLASVFSLFQAAGSAGPSGLVRSRASQTLSPEFNQSLAVDGGEKQMQIASGEVYEQPPALTAVQEAGLEQAAIARQRQLPFKRSGEAAMPVPLPVEPPTEAKFEKENARLAATAAAPGDFKYLTISDLDASAAPGRNTELTPSVAAGLGAVFMTGDWFAARSLDFGRTWKYVNPFTTFPSVNKGFCCAQDTLFHWGSSYLWSLTYLPDTNNNTVRLARANVRGLAANQWNYYDFTPSDFGYGAGHYLDYPKLSLSHYYFPAGSNESEEDLVMTAEVYKITGDSFVGTVIWRIPLSQIEAGGTISWRYYKTDFSGVRCASGNAVGQDGEVTCAGFSTTTKLKILNWRGTSVFTAEVTAPAFTWMGGNGVATTPDGKNFAANVTSDLQAVWVAPPPLPTDKPSKLIVAWGAKQDATFPFPYVIFCELERSTSGSWSIGKKATIWSRDFAWLYPAGAEDGTRAAGTLAFGGGTQFPGANVWTADSGSPTSSTMQLHGATGSNAGPSNNRWGRDFAARSTYGGFVAVTHYLKDGGGNAQVVPRFLWFGREGSLTPAVGAVNAASYQPRVARESIVAVFGSNLATRMASAITNPLPSSLADRTVLVGHQDLWTTSSDAIYRGTTNLFFVSPGQINLYLQNITPNGAGIVQVTDRDRNFHGFGVVEVVDVAPGLFTANANGKGIAAAVALRVRANGSQSYEPIARWDGAQFVAAPLNLGATDDRVFLILFGTGWRHRSSLAAVSVRIGSIDTPVLYAGEQGLAGLDQLNVQLPRNLAGRGEMDVILTVDGQTANTIRVHVQ